MEPHSRIWTPIEDLPANWRETLVNPDVAAVLDAWKRAEAELRNRNLFKEFLDRLQRQWAIETGAIEGLYTLSEGATLTLIDKGLDAALISHDDTDGQPQDVINKIKDQHQAISGIYQFVSGKRPLGTSYVRELHQVITAHQPTYTARDTLGNWVERDLRRGEWKSLPNNVEGPDGFHFEFCPPEHVAAEMDRLLQMHSEHLESGVPPDVEAAWLHHRFSLVHPFTDGNGRVARCLATLVLLKGYWFPLVITRKGRANYIAALRSADQGDLKPLVDLIDYLQRRTVREAMSLGEDLIHETDALDEILSSVDHKLAQQQRERTNQARKIEAIADSLQLMASQHLDAVATRVHSTLETRNPSFRAFAYDSPRNQPRSKYHYYQIISCAQSLHYFANFSVYQAWAALAIETERRTEILLSFHGIGHQNAGLLGCTAMIYTKDKTEDDQTVIGEVTPLCDEPFEFALGEEQGSVESRFRSWLEERVLRGLSHWRNLV